MNAQIHRKNDKVAIYLDGGETVYLSAENAYMIARAIKDCAHNINTQPDFSSSIFSTRDFIGLE